MRKISQVLIVVLCAFVVTTGVITCGWNGSKVFGDEKVEAAKDMHISKSTPTRSLMQLISAHTSRILDAIMVGDFLAVAREANAVAENSEIVMEMFFSSEGEAGDWHLEETGGDSKAAEKMKVEFEKYLKITIDTSRNIAETAGKKDIVETYKSLDEMLQKACFACHAISRDPWPDWPDWMRQAGG